MTRFEAIDDAEEELDNLRSRYVRQFGWTHTCQTPGSYWLWRRDFAAEDAERHRQWRERGPGPLGWPSEPRPYGVITASLDLAVSITRAVLDPARLEEGEDAGALCEEDAA